MPRLFLVALLALAGCGRGDTTSVAKPRFNAGGSTFAYPMMSKWASVPSVHEKEKGVQVNYQSIGTGRHPEVHPFAEATYDLYLSALVELGLVGRRNPLAGRSE